MSSCAKVCQGAPSCSLSQEHSPCCPMLLSSWPSAQRTEKEVTVRGTALRGGKQANSSNLLKRFSINLPPPLLGFFTDSFSLFPGGVDPLFLQAFLLSALPSFLHNCCCWTLAFHFIFIWLLPQLPIFEHFAYYQSGPSCTLLSSILLIGLSMDPASP